eukprot:TRINITY_DN24099_c0_g1_i1.p1 TRINITY_DN24099_c0_g1~~TRINITY_DN24099_c0_g1_i1.p1  ORF type:complete len:233 (+),score=73.60 TRINITY_DN24099_c0_g1_i1:190-888(+)
MAAPGPANQLGRAAIGGQYTNGWRPRCIEDTVDAGVHPVVAAMRMAQKNTTEGSGRIVEGMDLKATPWIRRDQQTGYTFNKRNGAASAAAVTNPHLQLERLVGLGVNTQDYMHQAKKTGMNPVAAVLKSESGPYLPGMGGEEKKDSKSKKKEKKGKSSKKKSSKKKEKKKKDKKKKKKKEKKKKEKKKKKSSSSSGSSSSGSDDDGSSSGSSSDSGSSSSASGGDKKRKKEA